MILLTDAGLGTAAIMVATKSKNCVWRWQGRFMDEDVDGLLRDKTQPPGIAPLQPELVDKVESLSRSRRDHRSRQMWAPNVGIKPLDASLVPCETSFESIADIIIRGSANNSRPPIDKFMKSLDLTVELGPQTRMPPVKAALVYIREWSINEGTAGEKYRGDTGLLANPKNFTDPRGRT